MGALLDAVSLDDWREVVTDGAARPFIGHVRHDYGKGAEQYARA